MLTCPVCKENLQRQANSFVCPHKHSFDISSDGYVNLFLDRKGAPGDRGDSREMLKARREFLQKGYFDSIYAALCEETKQILGTDSVATTHRLLDVGCGEGYALRILAKECAPVSPQLELYGLDVSKDALRMASRAHKQCTFFLANVHHEIPCASGSTQIITCLFAPRNFKEFERVLVPQGSCFVVIPTPRHLAELRAYIDLLKIDEDKEQQVQKSADAFELVTTRTIEQRTPLLQVDMRAILTMTPNFWHQAEAPSLDAFPEELATTFSVKLLHLRSRHTQV